MFGLVGVTDTDTSVAGVTDSVVDPETLPNAAMTVINPEAIEVANPLEPAVLLMVATAAEDELQFTNAVKSCVVLSENVPMAVNWWFVPAAMLELVGVTAMDTSVADVTFSVIDPQMPPRVALIIVLPMPLAITVICPGEFTAAAVKLAELIVATLVSVEIHVAEVVRSCVELSVYVPIAVNCLLVPVAIIEVVGVMLRDTS
jgi:hypothetical protein